MIDFIYISEMHIYWHFICYYGYQAETRFLEWDWEVSYEESLVNFVIL